MGICDCNAIDLSVDPTIIWTESTGATSYEYCLDTTDDDVCSSWINNATVTSVTLNGLSPNTTYFWQVKAINSTGATYADGSAANFWSFTTGFTPGIFTKTGPSNGTTGQSTNQTLSWGASAAATTYQYCYDLIDDDDCSSWIDNGTETSVALSNLSSNTIYYWQVKAVNSTGETYGDDGDWWSFTTINFTPVIELKLATSKVSFNWDDIPGATQYKLQLSTSSTFSTVIFTKTLAVSEYAYGTALTSRKTYYWRIQPYIDGVWGAWYPTWTFYSMNPPLAPTLASPASGAYLNTVIPELCWNTVANAVKYEIWVDNSSYFTSLNYSTIVDATELLPNTHIVQTNPPDFTGLVDGKYYWKVRGIDEVDVVGAWSAYRSFIVDTTPQAEPKLYTPADKAFTYDTTTSLTVTAVTGANRYHFQLADNENFSTILLDQTVASTTYTVPVANALPYKEGYYWRVKSVDAAGNESINWSLPRSFTVTFQKTPAYGIFTTDTTPAFTWYSVAGATGYKLEIDDDIITEEPFYESPVLGLVTTHTVPLASALPQNKYQWRMWVYTAANPVGLVTPWRSLTVTPVPLKAPTLSSPASGAYLNTSTPELSWTTVETAAYYEIWVDNSTYFTSREYEGFTVEDETTHTIATSLNNGRYYWKVRTYNNLDVPGAWSSYRSFVVDTVAPLAPKLYSPLDNAIVRGTPTYIWLAATGANAYEFRYDSDTDDLTDPLYTSPVLTVLKHKPPLQAVGVYHWQVRARDAAGNWGEWSAYRQIEIKPVIPVAPVLTSPISGTYTNDPTPVLAWNSVPYGVTYRVQVSKVYTFTSTVIDVTLDEGILTTELTQLPDAKYYWRVRAINVNLEPGKWSAYRTFIVDTTPQAEPKLYKPADKAFTYDTTPSLTVTAVTGANRYHFQVADGEDFSNILLDQTVASTTYTVPAVNALAYQEGYYWRAKSVDAAGNESLLWSISRSFTVTFQNAPKYGAFTTDTTPTFTWYAVSGATGYQLEVHLIPDPMDPNTTVLKYNIDLGVVTSKTIPTLEYLDYGKYQWKVIVYKDSARTIALETPWRPLTITPTTLVAPGLASPASGFITNDNTPELAWNTVDGAKQYEIWIDNSSYFTSPEYKGLTTGTETSHSPITSLKDSKYYWKVRTLNYLDAPGAWSAYRSLTIDILAPLAPKLYSPVVDAIVRGTPKYTWLAATGANAYEFRYDDDTDDATVPIYTSPVLNVLSHIPPLQDPNDAYYWQVRARDAAGNWGVWSAPRKITINPVIPVAPLLTSPASASTVTVFNPTFTWNSVPYGVNYEIQIDDTSTMASPIVTQPTPDLSYTPDYLVNKTYYWRVRAINSLNEKGSWSGVRSVKVNAPLDTAIPVDPTGLTSTSHEVDIFSTEPQIVMTWNGDASDETGAGVAGYSFEWSHEAAAQADTTVDLPANVLNTTSTALADGTWYFLLRTCDLAGNCSTGINAGPYKVDSNAPTNPTTLTSTTNEASVPSNVAAVTVEWASDAVDGDGVGLSGYSTLWDNTAASEPDTTVEKYYYELTETSPTLTDGVWYFHLRTCDLMGQCANTLHLGPFVIDTQAPTNPVTITSTSHTVDVVNEVDSIIVMTWSEDASDTGLAGLQGYSFTWDMVTDTTPDEVVDLPATTFTASSEVLENGSWYFHLRTCDTVGNCAAAVHSGLYIIDLPDAIPPTNPSTLSSSSHTLSVFSNDPTIDMTLSEDAADTGGSSLAGYSTLWDQVTDTLPDTVVDQAADVFTFTSEPLTDGDWYFHLRTCDGDGNCTDAMQVGPYKIDISAPTNASSVSSTSHTVGGTSTTDNTIDMTWAADASDGSGSGVAGVSVVWDQAADTIPDNTIEYANIILTATSPALSNGSWYFHLRTCDAAGNCSDTQHAGPFLLNVPVAPLCGTIASDLTLGAEVYTVTCSLTINSGVTLTLLPGAILKFNSASYLVTVNGTLDVVGIAENPAIFTSIKDDTAGGDTNADGVTTTPTPGDWSGIYVSDTGKVNLNYSDIRYGGYNSTYQANLYMINNAQANIENSKVSFSNYSGIRINTTTTGKATRLTVRNSTIENNLTKGILVNTATTITNPVEITSTLIQGNNSSAFETANVAGLTFNNNQLLNNKGYAVYLTLAGNAVPDLSGVIGSGNSVNGVGIVGPFAVTQTLTSLPDLVYVIPSSGWTINTGVTLTIPAGQLIKAISTSAYVRPNGTLVAQGTDLASISFTSIKDDTLSGDSNADGTISLPAKGDWQGITVPAGGKAVLDFASVLYAGNTGSAFDALVNVDNGGDLTLSNSSLGFSQMYGVKVNGIETQAILNNTITDCTSHGIYYADDIDLTPLAPVIRENTINNTSYAIYLGGSSDGITGENTITNNTGTGNTYNAIGIQGKVVGTSAWSGDNGLYYLNGAYVSSGASLLIDAGSVVKLYSANIFEIFGSLAVNGSAENPVVITSVNDGEGRTPNPGDYKFISIEEGGSATFDHAEIRYGGYQGDPTTFGMIHAKGGSRLSVTNSVLQYARYYGIYSAADNPVITGNTISDCGSVGIYVGDLVNTVTLVPVIRDNIVNNTTQAIMIYASSDGFSGIRTITNNSGTGNTYNAIGIQGKIAGTSAWSGDNGLYYYLSGYVATGASLVIDAGSTVKLPYTIFEVYGSLTVNGTSEKPVVITSINDGEGRTPNPGDYKFISIEEGGSATFDHAEIRYGGYSNSPYYFGMIHAEGGSRLSVTNSVLQYARVYGIYVGTSTHLISGNSFSNIGSYAVYNANPTSFTVKAEYNWWGSANGPDPYGDGEGINYRTCKDPDTGIYYICEYYVDAVPWIGQDIGNSQDLIDEELPDEPMRNTAPMEPGVPYIESVKSTANFFYLGAEYSDGIEIRVDWNGSEEGRGTPGTIEISVDGLENWNDVVVSNCTEMGGYANINPRILKNGFNDIKFQAVIPSENNIVYSKTYTVRAIRFSAPGWLVSLGFNGASVKVTQKPEYTEFEFNLKVPEEAKKGTFFSNEIPFMNTFSPASLQWNGELVFRTTGYGEFKSSAMYSLGEDTTDYDIVSATGTSSSLSAKIYIFFDGSGIVQLPWYGEGLSADFDFEMGIGGEVAKRESILVLIPGVGTAMAGLNMIPIASQIINAIYIEGKIEPEISLSTGVIADFSDMEITWKNVSLQGKTKVTLTAGVELYDFLEASIYGGGEISPEFCLTPFEWYKTTSALFVGAKFKAFSTWEVETEERWEFVDINPDANCTTNLPIPSNQITNNRTIIDSTSLSKWEIENPDYSNTPYSVFARSIVDTQNSDKENSQANADTLLISNLADTLLISNLADTLLISNLYKSASPSLALNRNDAVLMWVHDDITLGDAQSKELMASYWNGLNWSAPSQVTDNLMVDFNPQLAFIDNTHVMAIWQQINDASIPEDATLTPEIGQKVELLYGIFDLSTKQWTQPQYITNNQALDHRVKLLVGQDGSVMVTWVQNASGQLMGDSLYPDQIMYATWNGSGWATENITTANILTMISYDAALYQATEGILVFSKGKYGDLASMSDLELYYTEWNGSIWTEPIALTTNYVADDRPSVNYTTSGERLLIWLQDNELMMLGDDWALTPIPTQIEREGYLLRDFETALDENDNIALIWSGMAVEGSDLFYSLYDAQTGSWLLAEKLTDSAAVEKQTSASFDGSGQLMIAYALDNYVPETIVSDGIEIPNVMQYQSTDLHVLHYTPDSDLTVTNLSLPYRPNPEPGETVLIQASIVNSGDWSVENPSISFYDGEPSLGGVLIGTYNHTGFITAGSSATAEVQWLVPADTITSKSIFAVVDPENLIDERDETNNSANLTTILPDLTASSVSSYYYDQQNVVPLAVIYNSGKLPAEDVLVQFRDGAIDGPVVYSEVIPIIEKEGMVAVSTEINVSGWTPGNYKYFVTIDENAEIEEMDEINNSDYFSIAVISDLVIYAGDIVATLEEGIGGPVNVTVRNWGTYNASNISVNLYEGPDIDLTKTPLQTWNISSLAVDGVTTLATTVDHIPYNLFAVVDPDNIYEEIDESNNVAFEDLPIVHGSPVTVVGASDPNLDDIIYTPAEFDESTGVFEVPVEANLYDVSTIIEAPQLCDISSLTEFTGLQGKIALVEKSTLCTHAVQIKNAGSLGAVGVLVYNNLEGGNAREVMSGLPVSIPAGFLPRQDGLDMILFHDQLVRIASEGEAVTILDPYR